jgi:hypothetical protein
MAPLTIVPDLDELEKLTTLYDTRRKYGVIVLRSAGGSEADAERLAGRVFRRLRRADAITPPG